MEPFLKPAHSGWLSALAVTALTTIATFWVLISKRMRRKVRVDDSGDEWDEMLGI